jgi:hypothetical protein
MQNKKLLIHLIVVLVLKVIVIYFLYQTYFAGNKVLVNANIIKEKI